MLKFFAVDFSILDSANDIAFSGFVFLPGSEYLDLFASCEYRKYRFSHGSDASWFLLFYSRSLPHILLLTLTIIAHPSKDILPIEAHAAFVKAMLYVSVFCLFALSGVDVPFSHTWLISLEREGTGRGSLSFLARETIIIWELIRISMAF